MQRQRGRARFGPAGGRALSAVRPARVHRADAPRRSGRPALAASAPPWGGTLASGRLRGRSGGRRRRHPRTGLLAKYQTRVLMVTTGACAVHCRYCFRRHYPYEEAPPNAGRLGAGAYGNRRGRDARRSDLKRRRPADAPRRPAGGIGGPA